MIQVDSLSKAFGRIAALSEVSFRARDGQITGLLGPKEVVPKIRTGL